MPCNSRLRRPAYGTSSEASFRQMPGVGPFLARRYDTFAEIETIWRCFEAKGASTAFQQFDWMTSMKDCLAAPARGAPFAIEISDAASGKPLMLFPFILLRRSGYRVIEYFSLGVSDISAALIAPGYDFPQEAGALLWRALSSVFPEADIIRIEHVCDTVQGTRNPLSTLPDLRPSAMRTFETSIDGDPDTIVSRVVRGQTRSILVRSSKRLAELGGAHFTLASSRAQLDDLLPVMIAQRIERFRQLERFDPLSIPHVRSFYEDAAIGGAERGGQVRVFGLSVGGEWVATGYGIVEATRFRLLIVTMADGRWAACSPGMAIIAEIVRWARRQDLTVMDFSIGELPYKAGFGAEPRDLKSLCKALTIRGRAVLVLRRRFHILLERVRSRPRLLKFLRRVRCILRRWGSRR